MKKEFVVGLVFLIAIALVLFGTITVSGISLFKSTTTWNVEMKDIGGLQTGDDVRILGYRMGIVRRITFDPNADPYKFRIRLEMNSDAPIREGYEITVRDSSTLAGKYLSVEPGKPSAPLANVRDLKGTAPLSGGMMGGITDVLSQLKTTVSAISEAKGTVGNLVMKDDLYRDLKETSTSLRAIAARIESGQGTLGHLVSDDKLYTQVQSLVDRLNTGNSALARLMRDDSGAIVDDLSQTSANIRSITAKIDQGKGSAGLFVNDRLLYDNTASALGNASYIIQDVRQGKGVAGMLFSDEKARTDIAQTADNVAAITQSAREGKGSVGQFLMKDDVYNNVNSITQHFDAAAAKIDNGTGTIGKLINDAELYERVKRLAARAVDTIENARDSAPVSGIIGFLVGPFQ